MSVPSNPEPEKVPDSQTARSGHTPDRAELRTTNHGTQNNKFVIRPWTWYTIFALNTSVVLCGPSSRVR
jgi:hypothetical protein